MIRSCVIFFHRGLPSATALPYLRGCVFHIYLHAFACSVVRIQNHNTNALQMGTGLKILLLRIHNVFNKPPAPKMFSCGVLAAHMLAYVPWAKVWAESLILQTTVCLCLMNRTSRSRRITHFKSKHMILNCNMLNCWVRAFTCKNYCKTRGEIDFTICCVLFRLVFCVCCSSWVRDPFNFTIWLLHFAWAGLANGSKS